jgi:hypothetical protein
MLRLFARGKREEGIFVNLLRRIGVRVDREQHRISDVDGHFGGSLDAILSQLPGYEHDMEAVLECKTSNERNFYILQKERVQKAHPEHYAQMQSYMHGANVWLALYMVVNKNTDELYLEWVPYNRTIAENLIARARSIIHAPLAPNRISNSPSWFQCQLCQFKKPCHMGEPLHRSCRTCRFSSPAQNGTWICRRHQDATIPLAFQLKGCDNYMAVHD